MLQLKPGVKYDMPAAFGPSIFTPITTVPNATLISTSFDSRPEAVAAILPPHLTVGDVPTVYINRLSYDSVDYLCGRGYEEIIVAINARYRNGAEDIAAPYICAVWVNQVAALTSGREFMGHPKLFADIPALDESDESVSFEAVEYGTCFLHGDVKGLKELPSETVAKITSSQSPYSLAWKYIAGPGGTVDANYGTLLKMEWNYEKAWLGEGEAHFQVAPREQLPVSSHVVEVLAALPVVKRRPAFMGKGPAVIHRAATRRLENVQP